MPKTAVVSMTRNELRVVDCALYILRNDGVKLPATEKEYGELQHKIRMAIFDLDQTPDIYMGEYDHG